LTTKIHLLADARGRPLRILITPGQVHDSKMAAALLDGCACGGVIADKAFDTNDLRKRIADMGAQAVIPSKRSRKIQILHDQATYRTRNRIERCINKIKHFRRVATRYDRRSAHFLAFVVIACIMIWMR
jgi:transposase